MERLLQQAEDDVSTSAPLFAAMLSLPVEERYGPIELSAEQRREKIITAMVGQVVALSQKQPVLVVMEDAHWIDPTTELFLTQLRQTIAGQAIMIVVTHRPHYSPPLLQSSEATKILLERLNQQQSEDVVHGIGGKLASSIVQRIVARADGIPLFLEELTKSVAEAKTTDPSSTVLDELPTSLQATLLARLDRLDLPREVLQIGAVIGRSFSHDLIAAVIGGPEDNLRQDLTNIVKSELINCRGDPPDAIYSFKHALIHDAAYDTLLRSKRRYYHGTIADILLKEFPDRAEAEPGVLARHLSEAQQPERAVEYWQKAGRRASERSENNEAITSFEHGLNDLQKIVGQPSRNQTELDIRLALGASLLAARGWSAETVRENYERAVELSAVADDDSKKINALRGLGNVYFLRGQINEARELIDQELKLISVHDDPSLEMGGFRAVGMCSFFIGDFVAARTNLAKANAIYDPAEHAAQKFSQGTDPAVIGLSMLGWTEWFLGHSEKAEANISAALDHAENLKHPFSLAYAQCIAASVYQCLRNAPRTLELSQAANATANENNYPYWSGWATMMQGWASANLGGVEQGIKQLRQGLEIYEATGARQIKPYALVLLADLYCQTGDLKAGLKSVSEAYGDGNPTDVSFFEAEALRVSGELRKLAGQPAAIDFLQRSDALASKQNSLALRLRARISIYKAANGADELANAHQSLAEVYADVKQNLSAPEMEQAQLILATQNPRS
jgi:predicted ATPase